MRRKDSQTLVRCHICHLAVSSTFGFVPEADEPDNHAAPCGLPCMGGGVDPALTEYHDQQCPRCSNV